MGSGCWSFRGTSESAAPSTTYGRSVAVTQASSQIRPKTSLSPHNSWARDTHTRYSSVPPTTRALAPGVAVACTQGPNPDEDVPAACAVVLVGGWDAVIR